MGETAGQQRKLCEDRERTCTPPAFAVAYLGGRGAGAVVRIDAPPPGKEAGNPFLSLQRRQIREADRQSFRRRQASVPRHQRSSASISVTEDQCLVRLCGGSRALRAISRWLHAPAQQFFSASVPFSPDKLSMSAALSLDRGNPVQTRAPAEEKERKTRTNLDQQPGTGPPFAC
ncbi:hypothetical protein TGDOM2_260280 [Toxoplasma gondii GAB2-2007-GAL-DOM2]|uniref:Uncharacterized protein n=4 Tax=Toxoplasma gondii TaxID=5811 RepID=A0A086K7S8_TOXGO|nr:hypothetical protein TGDOM2_260280 [Toxoplasma gondii GAB2-2007-GAL-DOM2]KFG40446.1 hypothetical protein TGFOU_260280 [Toxoplasma gondii FOU]PUA83373.1 hypothetical protein TGBR9_260280 [Toxoplasma gondii TgCATBr9]RQX71290.1 hypothetical protein TGCAST_260280 [Toxoplasma gondii CAST]